MKMIYARRNILTMIRRLPVTFRRGRFLTLFGRCLITASLLLLLMPVSLTVAFVFPAIAFDPASFSFNAFEGGLNPADQTLDIWNSGSGTLEWSVSDDGDWLSLSPASGNSTGETDAVTVTLSVNITGLSAGIYNADITITGAPASTKTVPVTLTVKTWVEHTIAGSFMGAYSVYATDVDDDGDIDVLGAARNDDDITWWENDGSESFTERTI